ncbi:MAG: aldo/keto reductase [Oscillospiraceae bacterium]|nr:aldo/keto reductase [Oscillospiraceae bacterium]
MALKSPLGFGMMRLPVRNGDPTDFDYAVLNEMVDTFIGAGYTYFDTSFVYHNGKSEEATRKAVVERYPRDAFTVATKFPTFGYKEESEIEPIFAKQLENLGVDYIDYYLLHNFQTVYYDGVDGNGGIVKKTHLIEHALKWKEEGIIRHLGFSFHSSAKLLDRILTEHPEFELVQIPFNYIDAESVLVQTMEAYKVIRKHGKLAVFMEPVKGGGLSMVPETVAKMLREKNSEASIASWAIRYAGSFDGVICTLSGMSTPEQVLDNIHSIKELEPVTDEEKEFLHEVVKVYKAAGPVGADLEKYEGLTLHGAPVTGILEAYNMCQLQPDPGFSDDNNYLKNTIAEEAHLDCFGDLPDEKVILADGTDATDEVMKAERWLIEHSF